jgi:hypothetical protein
LNSIHSIANSNGRPLTSLNIQPSLLISKDKAAFVGEDDGGRIKILRQHVKPELMPLESLFW